MHFRGGNYPSAIIFLLVWIQGSIPSPVSGLDTLPERPTPENGSMLDLTSVPNYFLRMELTHPLGASSDLSFKVKGPVDTGILVVIHSLSLRKGVPLIGPTECYEYIKFHNTDSRRGLNHSSFACGSITDELNELVGKRSFITGINEALSIDVHFTNQDFEGTASEQRTLGSNSTFVLDITAYSDCSKTSEQFPLFECSSSICIPSALQCDTNLNCEFGNALINPDTSRDELNCQTRKRESNSNETPEVITPSPTSGKPLFPVDISSSHWAWNWNQNRQKPETTTTAQPTLVIYYDHGYGPGGSGHADQDVAGWAQQVPLIAVLIIFLGVSLFVFGMCSCLARLNTRRHSAAIARCARRQDLGIPNLYSIPAPEGRVYFYPDCENRAYTHTPPPPAYHDSGVPEAPPSYHALFQKNASPASPHNLVAAVPPHTISVSTFDPSPLHVYDNSNRT